ncbi:MAG: response regulator [Calditrichaceae bacterium]|nr:response regulator [Calditrichaceae bacterium]
MAKMENKKRALVIDDEEALRDIVTEVLDMIDMESATASSGMDALKIASNHSNQFDVMVIDMYMPDLTGEETYEKLKEFYPNCPVLFISGLDRSEKYKISDPKIQFLKKPFAVKDLQDAINELINK